MYDDSYHSLTQAAKVDQGMDSCGVHTRYRSGLFEAKIVWHLDHEACIRNEAACETTMADCHDAVAGGHIRYILADTANGA